LHVGYLKLHSVCNNLLLLHCNSGCKNVHHCYVIRNCLSCYPYAVYKHVRHPFQT